MYYVYSFMFYKHVINHSLQRIVNSNYILINWITDIAHFS